MHISALYDLFELLAKFKIDNCNMAYCHIAYSSMTILWVIRVMAGNLIAIKVTSWLTRFEFVLVYLFVLFFTATMSCYCHSFIKYSFSTRYKNIAIY